ncbi:MAG: hydrogen peroxide-inducible genes activator [Myxococcales bacterium]|nr:hydrogen peroxide-inducible genes activator [Myxococcales bacterium]
MPSLSQLQYILAVTRTRHFGRAAEECRVAQPTLSAQIQKAENELGLEIFDRNQKPVAVIPKALPIIEHARQVISAYEQLLVAAQAGSETVMGHFALGVIPTLAPYVIPWFLQPFSEQYPQVTLTLYERPTEDIIDDLRSHRLDAGLLATPLKETNIRERHLFYDPFYIYSHPNESILEHEEVSTQELQPTKVWLLEDGHCVRTQVVHFCGLGGHRPHPPNVAFAAGGFETLRHLIDASGGYSLFPETYVRVLPRSVSLAQIRPFSGKTPVREVSLVYTSVSWKADILDALESTIRDVTPRSLRQTTSDGEVLSPTSREIIPS